MKERKEKEAKAAEACLHEAKWVQESLAKVEAGIRESRIQEARFLDEQAKAHNGYWAKWVARAKEAEQRTTADAASSSSSAGSATVRALTATACCSNKRARLGDLSEHSII